MITKEKVHFGPILKVKWAPLKFKSLLASCSSDKKVVIFELKKQCLNSETKWILNKKAIISESEDVVEDIKLFYYSQRTVLLLGLGSADGYVRLF